MSITQAWIPSYYVKDKGACVSSTEYQVPILLGIALRVSQLMGISPVRLRRSHGNWFIEVSPYLVVFQRLIMIISSILSVIGMGFDFVSKNHVRTGTAIFTGALWIAENGLVMGIYILRTMSAPVTTDRLIVLLKQMNKINTGLNHGICSVGSQGYRKIMIFSYILLSFIINISDYIWFLFNTDNHLVMSLYVCFYYQTLSVNIIQLQVTLVITAITSLMTALNNQLESLLQSFSQNSDDAVNSKYRYLTIRQLAQYYDQLCDMVNKVNKDSGLVLLLIFMLLFLRLLITPYNLMSGIVMNKDVDFIAQQSSWTIYHLCALLVIVEPCHWMQDQMDRTRYILSRLARKMGESDERVSKELDLFILQVQIKGVALAPMGVFTVSRPLVASIIGSVTTYLVIIIQMHEASEIL